jgi:hypothetical protein
MRYGPYWKADSRSGGQEILRILFLESNCSLQCLEEPAIRPHFKPDESSP